ncbi:hypothetical protein OE88DRAFT_1660489 [Heliocybe sulcata]|uniref:G-patch domain-containing protein n=1 Tax=Heliocybe sulcata TaxID=5364 RepID=A0A5C3N278_9AGAM|nr:hypothetical protein OE88DRAFT_1660489 [Heliocybe sulcata]
MGLSGRKEKQRIPHDPRNLSWADNAAKFGQSYLQKFGWDTSKGLGANSDGRTSHIKVTQKLDMMGIGAQHQKDPNGIAWKQQNEFERLLRRLNAGNGQEENSDAEEGTDTKVKGFMKAGKSKEDEKAGEKRKEREEEGEEGRRKKKKKRRAVEEDAEKVEMAVDSEAGASDDERSEKKEKKKRDKREKSSKKRKEKKMELAESDEETVEVETKVEAKSLSESTSALAAITVTEKRIVSVRPMAHRARLIRSKRMAYQDSAAVSEILGLSRSASQTPAMSTPAENILTSPGVDTLHPLTTSSKSVMDYFKEKLLAKSSSGTATPTESGSETPAAPGLGMSRWRGGDEGEEAPRMGLGARSIMSTFMTPSSAERESAPLEDSLDKPVGDDEEKSAKRKKEKKEKKARKEKKKES